MKKTILLTGATDGIGLETARTLVARGHRVLLHGRNSEKMAKVEAELGQIGEVETLLCDLSSLSAVESLAEAVLEKHSQLDVLLNNAGVYNGPTAPTEDGLDLRFAVNTVAPYLLTQRLLPLMSSESRIVNLSSAAQSPVDLEALKGNRTLSQGAAYAQSKLAITMWTHSLAQSLGDQGPAVIAVNPGSLLGSKMVKEAFGVPGGDLRVGADILTRAALSDEFAEASGKYFDNDSGEFRPPHPDGRNESKIEELIQTLEGILAARLQSR